MRSAGKENNYTWDLVKEKGKPTQNETCKSQEIHNVSPSQNVPCTNCNELTDQCFTLTWIWLVGCFGVKRPFLDSISVYIGPSPRERGKEERNDRRVKKCPNNPHPHPVEAQKALALLLSK